MRRWFWVLDTVVVLSFVLIGRDSHGFVSDVGDIVKVASPFLLALAFGVVAFKAWTDSIAWLTGLALASTTLVVGMLIRRIVFDGGTAPVFVVITAAWFFGLMVGWRLAALVGVRVRARRASPPSASLNGSTL
jgi:hypothetical protein